MNGSSALVETDSVPNLALGFWDGIEDVFGPIIHPLLDPILAALQDSGFRSSILTTIIFFVIVLGGAVFLVNEGPLLLSFLSGTGKRTTARALPQRAVRSTSRTPRGSATTTKPTRVERTPSRKEPAPPQEVERPVGRVDSGGVVVESVASRDSSGYWLQVAVANNTAARIEMVVVDVDLPDGIDMATGSFRMHRLGTIAPHDTEIATFKLTLTGGILSDIGGYVEFMSDTYEIAKLELPVPDLIDIESPDETDEP